MSYDEYNDVKRDEEPAACKRNETRDSYPGGSFPEGFIWSVATASYQIEGSWDADGKGENIWDRFSKTNNSFGECNVRDCDNGDVACDSYRQTARDIKQLTDMGIKVILIFDSAWLPRK